MGKKGNNLKKEDRIYGLDLLKIVMMLLVITFHFSDHGIVQLSYKEPLTFNWFILASARIWGGMQCLLYVNLRIFHVPKTGNC